MTDHLPECKTYRTEYPDRCICSNINACEQRVSKQWYERTLQGALTIVAGLYPFGYERLMHSLRKIEGP